MWIMIGKKKKIKDKKIHPFILQTTLSSAGLQTNLIHFKLDFHMINNIT